MLKAFQQQHASPEHPGHIEDSGLVDISSGVLMVSDGVGGANAGEVASETAVQWVASRTHEIAGIDDVEQLREWGQQTLLGAHQEILRLAASHPDYAGMGTTALLAICREPVVITLNTGDSRGRLCYENHLHALTRDHTLLDAIAQLDGKTTEQIQELDQITSCSQLTDDQITAQFRRQRHVLTSCLGYPTRPRIDIAEHIFPPGAIGLLYTDGIGDTITEDVKLTKDTHSGLYRPISLIVGLHGLTQNCANELVQEALTISQGPSVRNKQDDIWVIVFGFE